MVVNLLEAAKPMRVRAALSRDGIEVYGDSVNMNPLESQEILLQVIIFLYHFIKVVLLNNISRQTSNVLNNKKVTNLGTAWKQRG